MQNVVQRCRAGLSDAKWSAEEKVWGVGGLQSVWASHVSAYHGDTDEPEQEAHCGKTLSKMLHIHIRERNYYLTFIFKNEKLQFPPPPSLMYLSCSKELKIDRNFDMIRLWIVLSCRHWLCGNLSHFSETEQYLLLEWISENIVITPHFGSFIQTRSTAI